jgi:hypothetical protein
MEAVAFFEAEFPEVPVKLSLKALVEKKGKHCLTESSCRAWLKNEERRKRPPPTENFPEDLASHQEVAPPKDYQERSDAALAEIAAFRASKNGQNPNESPEGPGHQTPSQKPRSGHLNAKNYENTKQHQ